MTILQEPTLVLALQAMGGLAAIGTAYWLT